MVLVMVLELQSRIVAEVRLDYFLKSRIFKKQRFRKNRVSGISGVLPDPGFSGVGPSSGQIPGSGRTGQIWGPPGVRNPGFSGSEIRGFRGPKSGVFGVQNRGFPGSQIRGKSTDSATMVSVVSSSWDPDFGHFLPDLAKFGVPARKNPGPGDPEIRGFRGPKSGISGVRNPGFPGSGTRDFRGPGPGIFRDFRDFRDFGYPDT